MNKQTIITILLALVTTTPVLAQNLIKTATAPVSFSKRDFADTIKIKVIDVLVMGTWVWVPVFMAIFLLYS